MKAISLATVFFGLAGSVFAGPSVEEVIERAPRYDAPGPGYPGRGVPDVILYEAAEAKGYVAPRESVAMPEFKGPAPSIELKIKMRLQPSPEEKPVISPWSDSFLYTK